MTLTATSNAGVPISRSVTTTTGNYLFDLLPASNPLGYTITQVNQPPGLADGRDTPGTPFGGTGTLGGYPRDADAITRVVVAPGSNLAGTDYNFGELPPATLGDFVWDDLNGNGRQDAIEPGLDGLAVTLAGTNPAGGTFTLTTTTSGGGAYSFTGLRPGTYAVAFTTPSGYVFTIQNAPGVPADLDSDANRVTGIASVNLGVGQTNDTIDAGVYNGATLSGFVYRDFDINGIREPNGQNPETGIVGVTITLTGVDPNGTALPTLTTITLADGSYQFGPIPEGVTGNLVASFFAFDPGFSGGLYVAVANGEIVVGSGAGGGPRVSGFRAGWTRTLVGDANGNGRDEIVVGPGAGGGPAVAIFDGNTTQPVSRFFAYPAPDFSGGIRVAAVDANGDGRSEVVAAPGPVAQPWVRVLSASSGDPLDEFLSNAEWRTGGVYVGCCPLVPRDTPVRSTART